MVGLRRRIMRVMATMVTESVLYDLALTGLGQKSGLVWRLEAHSALA